MNKKRWDCVRERECGGVRVGRQHRCFPSYTCSTLRFSRLLGFKTKSSGKSARELGFARMVRSREVGGRAKNGSVITSTTAMEISRSGMFLQDCLLAF